MPVLVRGSATCQNNGSRRSAAASESEPNPRVTRPRHQPSMGTDRVLADETTHRVVVGPQHMKCKHSCDEEHTTGQAEPAQAR